MAQTSSLPQPDRVSYLMKQYEHRTITIPECYEFLRWLQEAYLQNPHVPKEQIPIAHMIFLGVQAKLIDLEHAHGLRGQTP